MHTREAGIGDHVCHDLHRIVLNDADIFETTLGEHLEQGANTRRVNLDTNEALVGP